MAVHLAETSRPGVPRPEQFGTGGSPSEHKKCPRSVQAEKHSLHAPVHYGKTDLRYWQAAVFQPRYTRNGVVHRLSEWTVKIQHLGRRETFPLGTANRIEAAAKAKKIYLRLKSSGWETALTNIK